MNPSVKTEGHNPQKNPIIINSKIVKFPNSLKACTDIDGFDVITDGLSRGRRTLIEGGPGSGKTILALQTPVNGARNENEPGIFVAFVEGFGRITADSARFGWDLSGEHSVAVRAICQHVIRPFVPKSSKANFVLEVKWAGTNS